MTDATNAPRTASALSVLAAGVRQFSPAIERVSVQSLRPYPRNARRHSKAQIKQIAASIERFGFSNPVLVADDGEIVAGHGRVVAAKLLGIETVPAVRLSHLSEVERRAYLIADNKLALNAGWDRDLLAIELQGLVDLDFEIELTGFSLAEVDIVLDEARESAPDGGCLGRGHDPSLSARRARCYATGRRLDARAAQTHLRRCTRGKPLYS